MKYLLLCVFVFWHSLALGENLRLYNLGELLLDYDVRQYPKVMQRIQKTAEVIEYADVVFGNLETAIEPSGLSKDQLISLYKNPSPRVVHHTPASAVDILSNDLKVNVFSMANNHSFDLGVEGLLSGIDTFEKRQLVYAGIGRNQNEARAYKVLESNGKKIAFFSFTNITLLDKKNVPLSSSIPTSTTPGLYYISGTYNTWDQKEKRYLLNAINALKLSRSVDYILVSGHLHYTSKGRRPWASNGKYPTDFAREIIDAGADAFLVEGPHAPKGFEIYRQKPIFYGVGNVIFNTRKNVGEYKPYRWYSYIADTIFDDNQVVAIKIIPLIANDIGLYGDHTSEKGLQQHLETRGFGVPVTGENARKVLTHIETENKDNSHHDFTTHMDIDRDFAYWPDKTTYQQALASHKSTLRQ